MSSTLPPNATSEREQAIRNHVRNGNFEVSWGKITSTHGDRTAEFWVFADALKIDGVRVNVSAETQQVIADLLGCTLLTPKLADLLWAQRAVTLPPFPRGNTKGMSTTQAMFEHSEKLDKALAKLGFTVGIIGTTGKHWVIDNSIADGRKLDGAEVACNYGWHFEGAKFDGQSFEVTASQMKDAKGQFVRLIQGRGTRHNLKHTDYSQVCVLVSRECTVDGQAMDLLDLLRDPALAPLASHQGVMKCVRQPGVAPVSPVMSPEVVDLGEIDDPGTPV